jgi:Fe-S oxidoreductase
MKVTNPHEEVKGAIIEAGGEALKSCYQCGFCTAICPWNLVIRFPARFAARRLIHQAQLGLVDFKVDDIWMCTTCIACAQQCPRGVEMIDVMRALRRVILEFGVAKVPDSLRITLKNISKVGNPFGEEPEKRADWAKGLDVKIHTKSTEILYFPCCTPAYDTKVQGVARAAVNILKKAGVDFGILGAKEVCCGESVRKVGDEALFQSLAQSNINAFVEAGVKKIVTTSPHCYSTFKNEYSKLGGNFEVFHFCQYLAELIQEGKLKFTKELNKRVSYHDPCYLGRHNGIYDKPRVVLESIPGLELIELPNSGEDSLCCGGGGGRVWMETKKGERFSDLRVEGALEVKADILATCCPYCIANLTDSVLTMGKGDAIEIKDISELIQEVI